MQLADFGAIWCWGHFVRDHDQKHFNRSGERLSVDHPDSPSSPITIAIGDQDEGAWSVDIQSAKRVPPGSRAGPRLRHQYLVPFLPFFYLFLPQGLPGQYLYLLHVFSPGAACRARSILTVDLGTVPYLLNHNRYFNKSYILPIALCKLRISNHWISFQIKHLIYVLDNNDQWQCKQAYIYE